MPKATSVTFRCSELQHSRLKEALKQSELTRTEFISKAVEEFLDFAEKEENRGLTLFELISAIDAAGEGERFEDQV